VEDNGKREKGEGKRENGKGKREKGKGSEVRQKLLPGATDLLYRLSCHGLFVRGQSLRGPES
jgi:hypothetical protein